ncbi:MAG TPA: hypothetical protein VH253_17260 [Phycisphaerae bacterium]|nr:hypothetical protein [Phycisphaerae bacterium]
MAVVRSKLRGLGCALAAGLVFALGPARGRGQETGAAPPPPPGEAAATEGATDYVVGGHSDSRFATDLLRLGQVDVMAAEAAAAKGKPAENLWKSERILAGWDDLSKTRAEADRNSAGYTEAVGAYLDSQAQGIDGIWALDQAKFVLSRLADPMINRLEYWSNTEKERRALAPLAALAQRLLDQSKISLAAGMRDAEKGAFDEAGYMRAYSGAAEAEYYGAWGDYYSAMAMDPGDAKRQALLSRAITTLGKWADAKEDTGVNNQSLLLRGKAEAEAGNYEAALKDLGKAENAKAPAWVQYQARYQTVVVHIREKDYAGAQGALTSMSASLPADNADARNATDILAYRLAWAEAEAKEGVAREQAEQGALGILDGIVRRDPRYRGLVFEEIAEEIPDHRRLEGLHPLQQLAIAYADSLGQKGETAESKEQVSAAAAAAEAVYGSSAANPSEKLEAAFLAGVCNALIGKVAEAAKYNVAFAEVAPASDPRTKPIVELAIQQIGELRKAAGEKIPAELQSLSERALAVSTGKLGEDQWKYAQARTLEDGGQLDEAANEFEQIPPTDKNYLDAQFHLIAIATRRLSAVKEGAGDQARAAAKEVFGACDRFMKLLANPPASVSGEALAQAKNYVPDIWLIEAGAALNPAVKDSKRALDRLDKLAGMKEKLSGAQQAAVMRYQVQAYQMAGQADKAFAAVEAYAKTHGQDALEVIKGMAVSSLDEIKKVEETDPSEARRLADYVAKLMDPIIAEAQKEGKGDTVFEYKEIQADMLVRAGHLKEGRELAIALEKQKPGDLRSFMTEARACFAIAQASGSPEDYAYARDFFERIQPQITPGVDTYWECWLRIIQCVIAINGDAAAPEIKKHLSDLHELFGDKLGGDAYHEEFAKLVERYGG